MDEKLWAWTNSDTKMHAFINGAALCHKNIRVPKNRTMHSRSHFVSSVCDNCDDKFTAMVARAEASMEPSTGEGDYLPPAEVRCCDHASMDHGARGCDSCDCTAPRSAIASRGEKTEAHLTPDTEEQLMRASTGPLTERQEQILEYIEQGLRHKEIAAKLQLTLAVVRYDAHLITKKFKAGSTAQAVYIHAMAKAYQNAAAQILSVRIPVPADEAEVHVNHVLEGLAAHLTRWHDLRMPKQS